MSCVIAGTEVYLGSAMRKRLYSVLAFGCMTARSNLQVHVMFVVWMQSILIDIAVRLDCVCRVCPTTVTYSYPNFLTVAMQFSRGPLFHKCIIRLTLQRLYKIFIEETWV